MPATLFQLTFGKELQGRFPLAGGVLDRRAQTASQLSPVQMIESFDQSNSESPRSHIFSLFHNASDCMILRLPLKLSTKFKAGPLNTMPLDENPFADWSAQLFLANRTQYILLSNTKSFYSTVVFGRGISSERRFIECALNGIREFMEVDGQAAVYHRFIAPASTTVSFAKSLNRTVTGSMNELSRLAAAWLLGGKVPPHEVGFKLNDFLLSAIAVRKAGKYGRPRDAFQSMMVGRSSTAN